MRDPLLRVERLDAIVDGLSVLDGIDLDLGPGEFLALMGPNGSGKTTLLRCIAGLEWPTAGRISLLGRDITRLPAHRRGIGLLLSEPALFPNRSVLENVAYAPLVQRVSDSEARRIATDALGEVRLEGFEDRPGYALSMGERQRVALARAIAARPQVILLDEPFAAIDPEVRGELRGDFRRALSARGISAIHVTHDREEGLFLGDRVAVMLDGRIRALGTPTELLAVPGSAAVARFLGFNVLPSGDQVVAVDPSDTQFVDAAEGLLSAEMLASGAVGRESVGIARGRSGERIEARGHLEQRWPAVGASVGVRWTNPKVLSPGRPDRTDASPKVR